MSLIPVTVEHPMFPSSIFMDLTLAANELIDRFLQSRRQDTHFQRATYADEQDYEVSFILSAWACFYRSRIAEIYNGYEDPVLEFKQKFVAPLWNFLFANLHGFAMFWSKGRDPGLVSPDFFICHMRTIIGYGLVTIATFTPGQDPPQDPFQVDREKLLTCMRQRLDTQISAAQATDEAKLIMIGFLIWNGFVEVTIMRVLNGEFGYKTYPVIANSSMVSTATKVQVDSTAMVAATASADEDFIKPLISCLLFLRQWAKELLELPAVADVPADVPAAV